MLFGPMPLASAWRYRMRSAQATEQQLLVHLSTVVPRKEQHATASSSLASTSSPRRRIRSHSKRLSCQRKKVQPASWTRSDAWVCAVGLPLPLPPHPRCCQRMDSFQPSSAGENDCSSPANFASLRESPSCASSMVSAMATLLRSRCPTDRESASSSAVSSLEPHPRMSRSSPCVPRLLHRLRRSGRSCPCPHPARRWNVQRCSSQRERRQAVCSA